MNHPGKAAALPKLPGYIMRGQEVCNGVAFANFVGFRASAWGCLCVSCPTGLFCTVTHPQENTFFLYISFLVCSQNTWLPQNVWKILRRIAPNCLSYTNVQDLSAGAHSHMKRYLLTHTLPAMQKYLSKTAAVPLLPIKQVSGVLADYQERVVL